MNRRKLIGPVLTAVLFLCALLVMLGERRFVSKLSDQTLAARWASDGSFAQVSCYIKNGAALTENSLVQVRYQLNEALTNAGVGAEDSENSVKGRTLVDAYSTAGTLSVSSTRASASVRAFGVGGDFFLFHPMTLLSGTYFDGDDLNSDGVMLDEDTAWKLFGSYNVAGMEVVIGDNVYPVRGVVRRSTGAFSEAAGEDTATIYVSYDILKENAGEDPGITDYEILIKSPVTGFGQSALTESLGIDEGSCMLVENSKRFSLENRWDVIKSFGTRSMQLDGLSLPYWENRARAYEDVSALLLVIEILFLIFPVGWCALKLFAGARLLRQHIKEWAKGKKI